MKSFFLFIITGVSYLPGFGQKPDTGTYTFNYCDLEYKKCIGKCKVVIKGDSITVYATKELAKDITSIQEGDIIEEGIIMKHKSGKWIIGQSLEDINAKELGDDGPPILDFKKKQFWTF